MWGRDVLEPALRAAVLTLSDPARRVAEFHFGWCDEAGVPTANADGKGIQPTLAQLTAEAAGGTHDEALPAAVAVALIHGFAWLHDDVIEGGASPAHGHTACSVFGVGPAILTGSALQTLAFDTLAAATSRRAGDDMRTLSATVHDLLDARMTGLALEKCWPVMPATRATHEERP